MKIHNYIKIGLLTVLLSSVLTGGAIYLEGVSAQTVSAQKQVVKQIDETPAIQVTSLAVISNPKVYLNKTITMNAKFDKFSTLGLDYKPAFKSSDDYISFLIKRDDTQFDIPLSEMKLFMKRTEAEKFIDLKTNDEVKIIGTVFSDALGDAWIDVNSLSITKKAPEEKK